MKRKQIKSMLVISFLIGILLTTVVSVNAGEIEEGIIHVTINDNVYGSTSPEFDIPDETNVTFETIQVAGSTGDYYKVNDSLIIPLDVTCLKEKVYVRKMLRGGIVIAYRDIRDIPIVGTFSATVHKGELIGEDVNLSNNVSIKVDYELTEEQFNNGENMTLYLIACGTPIPGATAPFEWTVNLDDMLGDGIIGRILKEFTDISFVLRLNPLILAIKQVRLNIEYDIVGYEEEPGMYSINATVGSGNGTIKLDPNYDDYQEDSVVNVTAVADPGYIFDQWTGDLTGSDNPTNVTMNQNKTFQAHFVKAPVLIEIVPKLLNIGGINVRLVNQEGVNITDATVNITATGGILGLVNKEVNELVNISKDTPAVLKVKTGMFVFGPVSIDVKVTVGTEIMERTFSVMQIGPFVMA